MLPMVRSTGFSRQSTDSGQTWHFKHQMTVDAKPYNASGLEVER